MRTIHSTAKIEQNKFQVQILFNTTMSIEDSLNGLANALRNSNLHYSAQETPYSLYIIVRKKLILNQIRNPKIPPCSLSLVKDLQESNDALKHKVNMLENELETLKSDYEAEISDHADTMKTKNVLMNEVKSNPI